MLAPLMEGPDLESGDGEGGGGGRGGARGRKEGWGHWVRGQLARAPSAAAGAGAARSDLRMLLGVMGAPLAPIYVCTAKPLPHLSVKDTPIVSSSLLSLCAANFVFFFPRSCVRRNAGVKIFMNVCI